MNRVTACQPPMSTLPLAVGLGWSLPLALAGWAAVMLGLPLDAPRGALLLAAVVVPALALAWLVHAGRAGGPALALLPMALLLVSDATLPGARGEGLDVQSAAKLALWLVGLLLAALRWRELVGALRHPPLALMAAFVLWCGLGTLTSATPLYTAAASLALAGIAASAWLCVRLCSLRQLLLALLLGLLLALALSLALWLLAPGLALSPMDGGRVLRLGGVFGSPNILGRAAALALLLAVLAWPLLPRAQALALLLTALLLGGSALVLSDSRGSAAALAVALLAVLLAGRPLWTAALLLAAVASVLTLAIWPDALRGLVAQLSRSGRASEVFSFTGRTDIWSAVTDLIAQSPWLGHGFASTRELLPTAFRGAYGWTTTSAHNLWLQVWVTTGAVGLLLLLALQLTWLRLALRRPHPTREALVVFVLVVGALEASAFGPSVNGLSFIWCLALALGAKDPP